MVNSLALEFKEQGVLNANDSFFLSNVSTAFNSDMCLGASKIKLVKLFCFSSSVDFEPVRQKTMRFQH